MNQENRDKFLAYARLQSPREACGVLIVEKGKEQIVFCRNRAEYDQQFIINPFDYVFAEARGDVIGIVHSHPLSSPQPSEADLVSCSQTNIKWYIVGCLSGEWFDLEPSNYKAPLVGRSWCHGLLDCYSLVRDYYKQELNIEIPDYDRDFEWWLNGKDLYLENFSDAGFIEVDLSDLKKHDAILMQLQSPVINHAAIYLGSQRILHHLHKQLSSRDIYGGYWLKNTVKVVRHRSLINAKD